MTTCLKHKIFAYMNLGNAELKLHNPFFRQLAEQVPAPDLVVYLQAKPETLRRRIAKKNMERAIRSPLRI